MPYAGHVYNIPIHLWFPRAYPKEPPMVFVIPTQAMLIRSGSHTANDGRVHVPYMDVWQRKIEGYSLVELVRECQAAFSIEPPVMAKPKQPLSVEASIAGRTQDASVSPTHNVNSLSQKPAPVPSRPPKAIPYSTVSPPHPKRPERPETPKHLEPLGSTPGTLSNKNASPSVSSSLRTDFASGEMEPSYMPAPQRPMNPALLELHAKVYAKVSSRVTEIFASHLQSKQRLHLLLEDLERGTPAIDDEIRRLRAVRDICLTNAHRLTTTIDAAKRCTAEMEMRPEPDVDRMLSATSLVENQYVIVYVREMADRHKF